MAAAPQAFTRGWTVVETVQAGARTFSAVRKVNKVVASAADAVKDIESGSTLCVFDVAGRWPLVAGAGSSVTEWEWGSPQAGRWFRVVWHP